MKEKIQIIELLDQSFSKKKELLEFYNISFPKSKWSMTGVNSFFMKENNGVCFIVEKEEKISALIMGRINKNDRSSIILSALLVGDELEGKGYGKILVEKFIDRSFINNGFQKIKLHFRDSNDLRNFYEKFGFEYGGICGQYKNGEKKHYMDMDRSVII